MNEALERPGGSKAHGEQSILRPQRNLPDLRVIAGNPVGKREGAIRIDAGLKTHHTLEGEPVHCARNTATVTSGIRSQAHEIEPVPENQPEKEDSCKQSRKYHGPSRFRSARSTKPIPLAFP